MSDWSSQAKCRNQDPEEFFPHPGDHSASVRYVVCGACPVAADCLESALTSLLRPSGVWGGHTEAEVQRMWDERRNQRNRARRALVTELNALRRQLAEARP